MRFSLRQIEYFVATAETGSIVQASRQIPISQPAISAAIAHLEDVFGVSLFIRHHAQGLSLTPEGRIILQEARSLLTHAQDFDSSLHSMLGRVSGEITIGCMTTLFPLLAPDLIQTFSAAYPQARLHVVAGHHEDLVDRLRMGEISVMLGYDMKGPSVIDFQPLSALAPYAFVSADHRLAANGPVKLADLADEPFLLLDLPFSKDYFLHLFAAAGVTPKIVGRYPSMDVIRSLAARGEGFGLGNARPRNCHALDGRPLAYLTLDEHCAPLVYGFFTLPGQRQPLAVSAFLELCTRHLAGKPLPGTQPES
ncbi:MAG: LysR substrate-binding domain-containing protein [Acetobacter sp.]|uniref:LysR substrate-binding domain-containing protein n=1 Tax=Acetobacter sp. TaxID=440 RepID=UPI0039E7AA1C